MVFIRGFNYPQFFVGRLMSYLHYLCLLAHIVLCFCFVFLLLCTKGLKILKG